MRGDVQTIVRSPMRARGRRDQAISTVRERASGRRLALAGAAIAAGVALVFVARRWFWRAVGSAAGAVEEVADTVEDAAEDLRDLARERAGGD
jgi:hypothetical protein